MYRIFFSHYRKLWHILLHITAPHSFSEAVFPIAHPLVPVSKAARTRPHQLSLHFVFYCKNLQQRFFFTRLRETTAGVTKYDLVYGITAPKSNNAYSLTTTKPTTTTKGAFRYLVSLNALRRQQPHTHLQRRRVLLSQTLVLVSPVLTQPRDGPKIHSPQTTLPTAVSPLCEPKL